MWIALWNEVKSKVYQGRTKPSLISSSWDFLIIISGELCFLANKNPHPKKQFPIPENGERCFKCRIQHEWDCPGIYLNIFVAFFVFQFFSDKLINYIYIYIYNLTRLDGFSLNVRSCWLSKDVQLVYLGTSLELFHLLYEWYLLELSPASNSHHQDDFILNNRESLSTFLCDCYWMGGRLKVCVLSGETSNISCFLLRSVGEIIQFDRLKPPTTVVFWLVE